MDEWTFSQQCQRMACDANCMKCPLFGQYWREELGMDEGCEDEDYEE
jgi:hypothetical protein